MNADVKTTLDAAITAVRLASLELGDHYREYQDRASYIVACNAHLKQALIDLGVLAVLLGRAERGA